MTPQEVLDKAQKIMDGIGIATVYRALKYFFEEGWLVKVELYGKPICYERADLEHHHHFHCNGCDRIFDLPGCAGSIEKLLPEKFTMQSHEVILFGQCDKCNQQPVVVDHT